MIIANVPSKTRHHSVDVTDWNITVNFIFLGYYDLLESNNILNKIKYQYSNKFENLPKKIESFLRNKVIIQIEDPLQIQSHQSK